MTRAGIVLGVLVATVAALTGSYLLLVPALGAVLTGITFESLRSIRRSGDCIVCARKMPTHRGVCAMCRVSFPKVRAW